MDATHLHLLLNHFPIIGTLIAILILAYGIYSGSRRTTKAALFTIIVMSLIAIPVFLTGEPAEESVENLPGITHAIIEEHEEAAEFAIWMMAILGIISAISMVNLISKNRINKSLILIALFAGLLTFAAMARTGYLGGKIRHTEIRGNSTSVNQSGNSPLELGSEKEDDD